MKFKINGYLIVRIQWSLKAGFFSAVVKNLIGYLSIFELVDYEIFCE